jgi:hypothetical protein
VKARRAEARAKQQSAIAEGALDLRRRVLGPEHADTLKSMNKLAPSTT